MLYEFQIMQMILSVLLQNPLGGPHTSIQAFLIHSRHVQCLSECLEAALRNVVIIYTV